VDIAETDGKPFTLWLTDEAEESAVFSGVARWDGATLLLDRGTTPVFEIRSEWHDRIQRVTSEEARRILLGADYFLRLYVGTLPERGNASSFEQSGLKWPK
jgi:hypothetical protein